MSSYLLGELYSATNVIVLKTFQYYYVSHSSIYAFKLFVRLTTHTFLQRFIGKSNNFRRHCLTYPWTLYQIALARKHCCFPFCIHICQIWRRIHLSWQLHHGSWQSCGFAMPPTWMDFDDMLRMCDNRVLYIYFLTSFSIYIVLPNR